MVILILDKIDIREKKIKNIPKIKKRSVNDKKMNHQDNIIILKITK